MRADKKEIVYLVWQIEHPLVSLRAICAKRKRAELYKTMIMRDEKKTKGVYIEEALTNHLYAYKMINTIANCILYHEKED